LIDYVDDDNNEVISMSIKQPSLKSEFIHIFHSIHL